MKSIRRCLGALAGTLLLAAPAAAQYPGCVPGYPLPPVPYGGGYYAAPVIGQPYALPPGAAFSEVPFSQFPGIAPWAGGGFGGPEAAAPMGPVFPSHPFARSPRDYFMLN